MDKKYSKYYEMKQLADDTFLRVTSSANEWRSFLRSSSRISRYPFKEQLLIYAQKPEATACASYNLWNDRLNCYIKRGSKGIALIDDSSPDKQKLKYVFDVSDVNPVERIGHKPKLWEVREEHHEQIISRLETIYGDLYLSSERSFEEKIYELCENTTLDIIDDLVSTGLADALGNNILSFDDGQATLYENLNRMLTSSLVYGVLNRCNANISRIEHKLDFSLFNSVKDFNVLYLIGNTVAEQTEPILREIGRAVEIYDRKHPVKENAVDKLYNNSYNKDKDDAKKSDGSISTVERSEYGAGLHTGGRLSGTEHNSDRGAGGEADEVGADEVQLSEREQEGELRLHAVERNPEGALSSDTASGSGENGALRRTDGEVGERDESVEERESDEMGTDEGVHSESGRGDSEDGADLSVESEDDTAFTQATFYDMFPTVGEQVGGIIAAQAGVKIAQSAAFSLSDEKLEAIDNTARNYHISDDNLGIAPLKEKFRNNINAITTLKLIEAMDRQATPEEQEILSKYVGWGGLADVFDESKDNWKSEYQELKSTLTEEEYNAARGSVLNAHYTSPVIIRSIWNALEKFGFEKGNVLEPAMGIGNFFGMIPESMSGSKLHGVELDSITGRIAKYLYPEANISVAGFEEVNHPNNFFDIAVGNVPFGNYKVNDNKYNRHNFQIHDYFFVKTLDKVRAGGIVAFITSKGTLDKQNPSVRRYIAQRADLLGAIRLPNTAFKANAGTEVTSDIIFLQKRDRVIDIEPDWVHLDNDRNDITINSYFVDHPEMVLGTMEMVSGPYGMESTCTPDTSRSLEEQLKEAVGRINATYVANELGLEDDVTENIIPADPDVRNYSYTIVNDKIYYRENSTMKAVDITEDKAQRIRELIAIRNCTKELINIQLEGYDNEALKGKQNELNQLYDNFSSKFGLISSRTNKQAFSEDSSYYLLTALEKFDDDRNYTGKADMFTKRTIKQAGTVDRCDTASEALAVSLGDRGYVDINYIMLLTGKDREDVIRDLTGIIFHNPISDRWETSDEYLSGNIREKLSIARSYAGNNDSYNVNVAALERVLPAELDASEIDVRIGATWIDPEYIKDFIRDTFETPEYLFSRNVIDVKFADITSTWSISGKNSDYNNVLVHQTYGTSRANAYKILEDSLNLKETKIYDTSIEDGREKRVLNKQETMIASQKQAAIREAFKEWIFKDPERRDVLVKKYNELFNSNRTREFDGSHLQFPGMNPTVELKEHQKNAVARILYGGNTLLGHCVGAGKTFEMAAAAMEKKRLGLCNKSLIVVPNHLTEQWGHEFLSLYPGANILVATKKDFEPANRKRFCSRIATGEYDAVIIGHSQFEKIPLSKERQIAMIERQIEEIQTDIALAKADRSESYTVKQMEKSRKTLQARLAKLNDTSRKDNVVTFEELGIDSLFVDESHNYKNLYLYTKMQNVSGLGQSESLKSQDMFNKCRYIDELTGGKGIVFASGTPISNSMTELYTNMRYLQYGTLEKLNLTNFDAWASTFGETTTDFELAPEGIGYRMKTRFSKFFNLPELMNIFKEVADIQTADMLKLPVPEAEYENVVLQPTDIQKEIVSSLGDRAERVRNGTVDPSIDNMLKITNDGRKTALDQRLTNDMLPDEDSKASACIEKAYEIYKDTMEQKSTQLIFCDLSTPKGDGSFNVYDDIRQKLMDKGVPKEQIAFIHEANTDIRKAELFAKVRSGQVRFLLGSTFKMGAGTNVQDRLIALHHLDVPWRPSDIEQQEGRILRQGNRNPKVKIFRYVKEGTFDAYSWQLIENKQKFIGQIMTSKTPVRSCDDIDDAALSYAEVKALATGNPYIKEKMELDNAVQVLKLAKSNYIKNKYQLEDAITKKYPLSIKHHTEQIEGLKADIALYNENRPADKDDFHMTIGNKVYEDKKEAGAALIEVCKEIKAGVSSVEVGEYLGFKLLVSFDLFKNTFELDIHNMISHKIDVGADPIGNIMRINNCLEGMPKKLEEAIVKLENTEKQLENAKLEVDKPFAKEQELNEKLKRLETLDALLNMNTSEDRTETVDEQIDASEVKDVAIDKIEAIKAEPKENNKDNVVKFKTRFPSLREALNNKVAEAEANKAMEGGYSNTRQHEQQGIG